jgi:hypothetical protein
MAATAAPAAGGRRRRGRSRHGGQRCHGGHGRQIGRRCDVEGADFAGGGCASLGTRFRRRQRRQGRYGARRRDGSQGRPGLRRRPGCGRRRRRRRGGRLGGGFGRIAAGHQVPGDDQAHQAKGDQRGLEAAAHLRRLFAGRRAISRHRLRAPFHVPFRRRHGFFRCPCAHYGRRHRRRWPPGARRSHRRPPASRHIPA